MKIVLLKIRIWIMQTALLEKGSAWMVRKTDEVPNSIANSCDKIYPPSIVNPREQRFQNCSVTSHLNTAQLFSAKGRRELLQFSSTK